MADKIKVGIVKETKTPPDRRTAVTPEGAREMMEKFENIELFIESSDIRSFTDEEYQQVGANVVDDISHCDILVGVKEVKKAALKKDKTYMFFSHTAKKQEYNLSLLQELLKLNIRMVDHEYLTDEKGVRLAAFGHWAGVVGAYNGIRAYGKRTSEFDIPRAIDSKDTKTIYEGLGKITLPAVKILITGSGRVANGAQQTLQAMSLKQVTPDEFLSNTFDEAVYTMISPEYYVKKKNGGTYNESHFFKNPSEYTSNFSRFTKVTDIYIASHYWDEKSPKIITDEDIQNEDFKISVIADVSCDIADPISSTIRPSEIDSPFYGFNKKTLKESEPFDGDSITVMAVDNLPGEVPRDASEDFGRKLIDNVFPALFGTGNKEIIERASITAGGELGRYFTYLDLYAKGEE